MRIRAALITLALVTGGAVVGAPLAHATGTSYTWVGASQQAPNTDDSSWGLANNWSPAGPPGDGDSVTIAPPSADDCHAHVTGVPAGISLASFRLSAASFTPGSTCLASVEGGPMTVTGSFVLKGATLSVPTTLAASATGQINPASTINETSDLDADLVVDGTLNLTVNNGSSGDVDQSVLMTGDGTTLTVAHGATLNTSGGNHIEATSCCNTPARVVNHGTIADVDDLSFDGVALDQDGVLDTQSKSATVLSWSSPTTSGDGASYTGDGSYRVSGASASDAITGTQHIGDGFHFILGGGAQPYTDVPPDGDESMTGTFTLAGAGTFDWVGGHIVGHATVSTTGGAAIRGNTETKYVSGNDSDQPSDVTFTVPTSFEAGSDADDPDSMNLDDSSTVTLADSTSIGRNVLINDGNIVNTGHLTVRAGSKDPVTFSASNSVLNKGSLTVATGVLDVDTDSGYEQTGGTTTVDSGATLRLDGSDAVLRIKHGTLQGTGTVVGPIDNSGGTLAPDGSKAGTVTVHGKYGSGSKSALSLTLAKSRSDKVSVHGSVSLKGRIHADTTYSPKAGTKRLVLTSTGTLSVHLTCVGTTGSHSSSRHWVAKRSGHKLYLVLDRGKAKHC